MIPGVSFFWRIYTKERISEEVSWFLLISAALLTHRGLARALGERQWSGETSFMIASAIALMGAASQKAYAIRFSLLVFLATLYLYTWAGDPGVTLGVLCFFASYYIYKMFKYRNTYEVHV